MTDTNTTNGKKVVLITQKFGYPRPNITTRVIVRGQDSGMSAILTVTVSRTEGSEVDVSAPPGYLSDADLSQGE